MDAENLSYFVSRIIFIIIIIVIVMMMNKHQIHSMIFLQLFPETVKFEISCFIFLSFISFPFHLSTLPIRSKKAYPDLYG